MSKRETIRRCSWEIFAASITIATDRRCPMMTRAAKISN